MTAEEDTSTTDRLNAYLDGALSEAEQALLEAELAADPRLAAELEALQKVDAEIGRGFADMLAAPVPLHLARSIETAGRTAVGQSPPSILRRFAAAIALVAVGAGLGAGLTRALLPPAQVAIAAPGWLDQVAEYHAVYSAQGRHLVEVPAGERAHLETWLSEQTKVPFTVPDLSASGLEFQGARLLVASGKPVAQLMYRDAAGQVVALCFTYVVIGPAGRPDLRQVAEASAIAL
ncbi:MAG: anti-sigma factor [Tabrizicola sp.]|nr:anti-sigma factor [Tabrizicola sp.]